MFGLSWKLTAGAAVIAFVIGASSGAIVTAKFYKAAKYEAEIKRLKNDISKRDAADKQNAEQATKDRTEIDNLKGYIREIEDKISDGECLTGDDTRWLHDRIFRRSGSAPRPSRH